MERRIEKKAKQLPERVQQLVDDVSLMYYREYLNEDDKMNIWKRFVSISNRSQLVRDEPIIRPGFYHSGPELDLGFELGSSLRMINKKSVPSDLITGLIIGLIGEDTDQFDKEVQNYENLLDKLESMFDERCHSVSRKISNNKTFSKERELIPELLSEYNIRPVPSLVHTVILEYVENGLSGTLEPSGWSLPPDVPSDESKLQEDGYELAIEVIIWKLCEETQLPSVDQLAKDLAEDTTEIQNRQWRGVDPDQVFRYLKHNGQTHVQEFSQTETKGQNNVTATLRKLSYADSGWVNRPVVSESDSTDPQWSLTQYGHLLYIFRFEEKCRMNWLYDYICNPDKINKEIDSIISGILE